MEKVIRRCSSLFRGKNTDDVEISKLMRIDDPLLWCHDVGRHSGGDFSFAVLQSNRTMEDKGQVEVGRYLTFVGIYDGHGGPDASHYILNHLSSHFSRIIRERGSMSEEVLGNSFAKVEAEFLAYVKRLGEIKPAVTVTGSCCLVGVFCKNTLYIANLGDSRAVAGTLDKKKKIVAEQLTQDHNASREEIRQELKSMHPDDPEIVVFKNGAWRIKGITQISRAIGDGYMKKQEFAVDSKFGKFQLPGRLSKPILSAEPSISTRVLSHQDKFFIFASDGLWEHLTNQAAVEIVHRNPRPGVAKRLIIAALLEFIKVTKIEYTDFVQMGKGNRRSFHDDITVVVVFIDNELSWDSNVPIPEISVRGFCDPKIPSDVSRLLEN